MNKNKFSEIGDNVMFIQNIFFNKYQLVGLLLNAYFEDPLVILIDQV